ncbi:MAG: radical SAM protein [Candidatus Omnitrophica bacterium]|nr:radical SAM protein [Candidatus Omnitrophota bacterium]
MKVALIQCPQWSTLVPPYNLALLSSCLKQDGHQVRCYDFNVRIQRYMSFKRRAPSCSKEESLDWYERESVNRAIESHRYYVDQLVDELMGECYQAVGFSIYDSSRWYSEAVAAMIKKRDPQIKIVFGGFSCFHRELAQELCRADYVDAVCLGEGEIALRELFHSIEENRSFSCSGFLYKDSNSVFVGKPDIPSPVPLDFLPFADFSDFDLSHYDLAGLPISTSRGCINRCLFCEESVLWGKYRRRTAENVYEEIVYQLEKNPHVTYFHFNDSLINGDVIMLGKLIALLIRSRPPVSWGGQMMIRREMDYPFLKKAYQAGLRSVSLGLESGSEKVLQSMGKRFSLTEARKVIRDTHAAGIQVSVNIIVGFPRETWEDIRYTVDFLKRNRRNIHNIFVHPLVLLPASVLGARKKGFGIIETGRDRMRQWYAGSESHDFGERIEKIRFIKRELAAQVNIPFADLENLN